MLLIVWICAYMRLVFIFFYCMRGLSHVVFYDTLRGCLSYSRGMSVNFVFLFIIKIYNLLGFEEYKLPLEFFQYLHKKTLGWAVGFIYEWPFEDYSEEIGEDDIFTTNALIYDDLFYYHFTHRTRRRFMKYLR